MNNYFHSDDDVGIFSDITINSEYYNCITLADKISTRNCPLLISLNIQSLQSKFSNLLQFINELNSVKLNVDVIALQETWKVPHVDQFTIPGFHPLVYADRKGSRGGGVGFYIKSSLKFTILNNFPSLPKVFENIVIDIQYPNQHLLLSCIYRSPNPNQGVTITDHIDEFIAKLDDHLTKINERKANSYIFLDANINLSLLNSNKNSKEYLNTIVSNGFLPTITKATRIQNESATFIDQILTNVTDNIQNFGTLVTDVSDHFCNFVFIPHKNHINTGINKRRREFNEANCNRFKQQLGGVDWSSVTNCMNVNLSFDEFWKIFSALYDINFPYKTVRRNKAVHPINCFMTPGLIVSRTNKHKLHMLAIRSPTVVNVTKYKTYRNIFNSLVRNSKKLYFTENLKRNQKNPRNTWKLLKEAINSNKCSNKIDSIQVNDHMSTDPLEMAEEFNSFFSQIGTSISNTVNPTSLEPDDFIPPNPNPPELELGLTSPLSLLNIIKLFEPKSSVDLDGISMKLIQTIGPVICTPLSHIFNCSIEQGIFPEKLKCSRTVPVFKSGNPTLCDNYRPISLLPTMSKLLEKFISIQLTNHLELNNLLYIHQYGFQKNKSTEQNLIHLTNSIFTALNEKKYCIGLFLDLKKAFDVCSHEILLKKIKKYGLNGKTHDWFKSYLENRKQSVDIDGSLSATKTFNISVIQGSILGPILFLIYINDLYKASSLLKFMFADDTACVASNHNLKDLITYVNDELKKVARWFRANKMAVNVGKTKFILFHTKGKQIDPNIELTYDDNEPNSNDPTLIHPVERFHSSHPNPSCRAYKILGVYIDETLSFDFHTQYIISKLNRSLYCINKVKNFLPTEAMRSLYFALIHSHLSYCPIITSCASNSNIQKIAKIQKKAVRIITKNPILNIRLLFLNH
jgi:hypothetical protein